jgi:hypothetical protein
MENSNFSVKSDNEMSMVEIEENCIKWGQGFVENIDPVIREFIKYRGLQPLNVMFICKENKGLVLKILQEICREMNMMFFNKKLAVLESEGWESMEEGRRKEIYQEINKRREMYLEEKEQQKNAKENRKKKKNDPKNNDAEKMKNLISNEEMKEIMKLTIGDDLGMYIKGVMMMDVCDNIEQFNKIYDEGFLNGLSYIIEFTTSSMSIKDSEKKNSNWKGEVLIYR